MNLQTLATTTALAAAFESVRMRSHSPGVDRVTPDGYAKHLEENLQRLASSLADGSYSPSPLLRWSKPKPSGKSRHFGLPTVQDRIVIELLRSALHPSIERVLSPAAYAYRPRRSARQAVDVVAASLASGMLWAATADIADFFDSVRVADIVLALRALPVDATVVRLADLLLKAHTIAPGRGLCQGSNLSPILSNLVLKRFDDDLINRGFNLVRYCDNMCITTLTRARADEALFAIERSAAELRLLLKPSASSVVASDVGFAWLGFWIDGGGCRISDSAIKALGQRLDRAGRGLSGAALLEALRPVVQGWRQYFDAPLPQGARLGEYDAQAREILDAATEEPKAPRAEAEQAHELSVLTPDDDPEDWSWPDAQEEGRGATDDTERLLQEGERRALEGDFAGAESAFEQAERAATRQHEPEVHGESQAEADIPDEAIDLFWGMFAAGVERFEVAEAPGRSFQPLAGPPTVSDFRRHLQGKIHLAVVLRREDGSSPMAVLDIDGKDGESASAVKVHTAALLAALDDLGVVAWVEHTGGRGNHLWIPLSAPAPAESIRALTRQVRRLAGRAPEGVDVEELPALAEEVEQHNQAITLPLGVHALTGRRSVLILPHGDQRTAIAWDLSNLTTTETNDTEAILTRLPDIRAAEDASEPNQPPRPATLTKPWTPVEPFGPVAKIMSGCAVLRHLADKARSSGHLSHSERLSVLYALGHLGEAGKQAIVDIIAPCNNFDPRVTLRQIGRLTGPPIRCTRMREKHGTPELLPTCTCVFSSEQQRAGYSTPLLHAMPFRREWLRRPRLSGGTEVTGPAAGVGARLVPRETYVSATEVSEEAEGVLLASETLPHDWA